MSKINVNESNRLQVSEEEMEQAMEAANRLVDEEGINVNFFCTT